MASSFLYKNVFPGNTVMVIIPHEDDEINVAGAVIYGAIQEGLRVICVFVTNGDWTYPASVRIKESRHGLAVLGVPDKDMIFLGYPDGGLEAKRSVFMNGKEGPFQTDGRTETCGADGRDEFCYDEHGIHHAYTWENLLADLKEVILKYEPGTLIATDFDFHPEHRMCSMGFETVMGEILRRKGNKYFPLVLKGFAYSTAFEAVKDFYGPHLLSTRINREVLWNLDFETDNPPYEWNKRVRLPVPRACRQYYWGNNVLFHSLSCHISQRAFGRSDRIINGDQVFWRRRTDNLIFQGQVDVSSGYGEYLRDFCMMKTNDIRPRHGVVMEDYLWVPEAGDHEKYCQCIFTEPQHIEAVSLYGNIDQENRILKGQLTFSNGYSCEVRELKKDGHETRVEFPRQAQVTWIKFQILKTKGARAGLSEWEIFSHSEGPVKLLHILVDEHLAYDWKVYPREPTPKITAYTYGIKSPVTWFLDGGETTLEEVNKVCQGLKKKHVIHAKLANDDSVWDEISIKPASRIEEWKRALLTKANRLRMWMEREKGKPEHHRLRALTRRHY